MKQRRLLVSDVRGGRPLSGLFVRSAQEGSSNDNAQGLAKIEVGSSQASAVRHVVSAFAIDRQAVPVR